MFSLTGNYFSENVALDILPMETDYTTLCVIEYFAKSFKVTQNHSK